jgi:hypothetical protein
MMSDQPNRIAYSIEEAKAASAQSHRKIYEAINSGALKARKNGKRTIILRDDLRAFLLSLPEYEPKPLSTSAGDRAPSRPASSSQRLGISHG